MPRKSAAPPQRPGRYPKADRAGPVSVEETIGKPWRERQRLIGEICERLAGDLDEDVVALRRLIESRPAAR
jgi:hypothetical protein